MRVLLSLLIAVCLLSGCSVDSNPEEIQPKTELMVEQPSALHEYPHMSVDLLQILSLMDEVERDGL